MGCSGGDELAKPSRGCWINRSYLVTFWSPGGSTFPAVCLMDTCKNRAISMCLCKALEGSGKKKEPAEADHPSRCFLTCCPPPPVDPPSLTKLLRTRAPPRSRQHAGRTLLLTSWCQTTLVHAGTRFGFRSGRCSNTYGGGKRPRTHGTL